jgi:hypothetical protein
VNRSRLLKWRDPRKRGTKMARTYNEWLEGLPFATTRDRRGSGAVLDLSLCIYPSGATVLAYPTRCATRWKRV